MYVLCDVNASICMIALTGCSIRKFDDMDFTMEEWSALSQLKRIYLVVKFDHVFPYIDMLNMHVFACLNACV